jgi:hypothetical protein
VLVTAPETFDEEFPLFFSIISLKADALGHWEAI